MDETLFCGDCGHANGGAARFCARCGSALQVAQATEASAQAGTPGRASMPPGTSSVTGELESLAGLYEKGLITREEFEQQKRGLMGHGAAAASASAVARPTSIGAYEVLETLGYDFSAGAMAKWDAHKWP